MSRRWKRTLGRTAWPMRTKSNEATVFKILEQVASRVTDTLSTRSLRHCGAGTCCILLALRRDILSA